MMKASDPWQSDDSCTRGWSFLCRPPRWRVPQPRADSLPVVAIDIFPEESTEVVLVDHDHVMRQLASHGSDPAPRDPVLPRALICDPLRLDSELPDRHDEAFREDRVVVVDQIVEGVLVRERLA
jgi:hypothetical protein